MSFTLIVALIIAVLAIAYSVYNYFSVKTIGEGTAEMRDISTDIRIGANTFLKKEFKVLIIVVPTVAVIEAIMFFEKSAIALVIGAAMSSIPALFGMKMSTLANTRVTNTAMETKSVGKSQKVALRAGSVMGLSVAAFSLIGFEIIYLLFKPGYLYNIGSISNWIGIAFIPIAIIFSSYGLGCSIVAMFFRVGGGIFTKAADMAADLVGKTELLIDEDDPRNPAVIADCVGDNVNDTAGLGSDLLESNVSAIVGGILAPVFIVIAIQCRGLKISSNLMQKLIEYPIGFSAFGLLACIIALMYSLHKKDSNDPEKELDVATWISSGCAAVFNLIFTLFFFKDEDLSNLSFRFGLLSPWFSALIGIVSGLLIAKVTAYYTSAKYKPTQMIASASKMGSALNITAGLSVSMKSNLATCFVIGSGVYISSIMAGAYGIAMAAIGMLSIVGMTVSVDTFGPICDNAGGIAEMAKLPAYVRNITDKLDETGNTKAAIGKGLAIGSAAFATISLLNSYMRSYATDESGNIALNVLDPKIFFGVIVGAGIIWFFSGMLVNSVTNSAKNIVQEVRNQFKTIAGLKEGFIIKNNEKVPVKPDSARCVGIATDDSLGQMKPPALMAIVIPVISGFIFGTDFVSGLLFGSITSAIMLAIFFGNSGGAWDNAKKSIEESGLKGSPEHVASVVGDTVGDPLKDTAGPSLDIFIKIMDNVALVFVNFFKVFSLFK